jgi:hypothetical protein
VSSASRFPSDGSDGDGSDGDDGSNGSNMPDYAKNMIIDNHYLFILQGSENGFDIEEWVTFNNTGNESYDGKVYMWSQPEPGCTFDGIVKFDAVINDSYKSIMPYPSGNFLVVDLGDYNISIKPGEPLLIEFAYHLTYKAKDLFNFSKTFLYNNSNVIVMIKPYNDLKAEGVGIELIYNEESNTYATQHTQKYKREISDSVTFRFSKISQSNNGDPTNGDSTSSSDNLIFGMSKESFQILLVLIIIIICIIITFIVRSYRQKDLQETSKGNREIRPRAGRNMGNSRKSSTHRKGPKAHRDDVTPASTGKRKSRTKSKPESSNESRSALVSEKKKILKTKNRLKNDYKDDLISKETYDKIRSEYKQKLKILNKKITKLDKTEEEEKPLRIKSEEMSPELEKLHAKKEKILKAIKKLESDKAAGELDPDLYDEMSSSYKKQAIQILQEIDEIGENSS